jgi:glutamate dehydrogenase/leucine dehydrogenase
MSVNDEIHSLIGVAISAFEASEKGISHFFSEAEVEAANTPSKMQEMTKQAEQKATELGDAAKQSLHTLASLVLTDVRRIADALEILAKDALSRQSAPLVK